MDDVIVIGAGPAGLSAAVQLKRHALDPRVFESGESGGLLWNAHLVENYPGFPGGVSGRELARLFAAHARVAGVRVTPERVVALDWDRDHFRVITSSDEYRAPFVVVATGTKPRTLADVEIHGAARDKVFHEIKPLLDLEGARVAVVGGGDAAFDYALTFGARNTVAILNRGKSPKCLPLLYERTAACARIVYRAETSIGAVIVTPEGDLRLQCCSPAGPVTLNADYVVAAIGRDPQVDFISAGVAERMPDLERRGVLHFAGDVKNGMCRQTAVAVGDGVLAAMRVHRALKGNRERT